MCRRNIALLATPLIAVGILVPLLNALHADPGLAFAALGLVALICGAAIGVFFVEGEPVQDHSARGDSRADRRAG